MAKHFGRGRFVLALLVGVIAVTMLPGLAAAHSELVSSAPAEGARVPSPFSGPIVLTFTEHLASGSKADLVGADGKTVASATVAANTMTVTLATPLDADSYAVRWISVADDGDLLRGIVHFTVAAAAASPSASASAPPSASPTASTAPSVSPSPNSSSSPSLPPSAGPSPSGSGDTSGGGGNDVLIPIVVALVVLAAGAAYLLTQRNRPSNPA